MSRLDAEDVVLDLDQLATATSARDVLAIVRGDVMLGFEPKLSDTITRWLEDTRDTVRSRVIRSLDGWLAVSGPKLQQYLESTSAQRQDGGVCVPDGKGLGTTTPARAVELHSIHGRA